MTAFVKHISFLNNYLFDISKKKKNILLNVYFYTKAAILKKLSRKFKTQVSRDTVYTSCEYN